MTLKKWEMFGRVGENDDRRLSGLMKTSFFLLFYLKKNPTSFLKIKCNPFALFLLCVVYLLLKSRTHDQNFVPLIVCNKIVTHPKINVHSCQINDPPSQINVPHCQINVPSFCERIMTPGALICKRVTYLCPFLTMCTGPYMCK